MLGIPLFRPAPGVSPIEFDYELRCLRYVEWNGEWIVAGGDKSGELIVFRYDGETVHYLRNDTFGFKIISMDFVIYGEDENRLGLIVALEVKDKPNIFFNPNIETPVSNPMETRTVPGNGTGWKNILHDFGTPQLVYQPFITAGLSRIFFSFKDRSFFMADLVESESDSYRLEVVQKRRFTSCIIDACSEFPKNMAEVRQDNKRETGYIYLASKGGCILRLVFDTDGAAKGKNRFFIERLRTIHNSIRAIIPLSKIAGAAENFRGVLGIAGTDFFCLYRDKIIPGNLTEEDSKSYYRVLIEHYPYSLRALEVGTFISPEQPGKIQNMIMAADSQETLHCRQFESSLTATNLPELITVPKTIFREKIEDRIFGIVPVVMHSESFASRGSLMKVILGLGSHEIIFKSLENKIPIIESIQSKFNGEGATETVQSLEKQIERYIKTAREYEFDAHKTSELILAFFENQSDGDPLALKILKKGSVDLFIQLVYWMLSSSRKVIFQQIYKKICKLIQDFNLWTKDSKALEGQHHQINDELDRLLTDIDKFWIGGETYSGKLADLKRLIDINKANQKTPDMLIYQACLNDRGLAVEKTGNICDGEICAVESYKGVILAADQRGNLFLREDRRGFPQLAEPVNTRDIGEIIYKKNPLPARSQTNYIRQIVLLDYAKLGVLLLHDGGIWVFRLELLENRQELDAKKMFTDKKSRLIAEDVPVHSIKKNPYDMKYYLCDRLGMIYSLQGLSQQFLDNYRIFPVNETLDTRTASDFDFFPGNRVVVLDVNGNMGLWYLKNPANETIYTFTSQLRLSRCMAWNSEILIVGTEEGDICGLEERGQGIVCRWTYRLPGAIRYIRKTEDERVLIGGLCPRAVVIEPLSGKIESCVRLHPLHKFQEKPRESITAILTISPTTKRESKQTTGHRLLFTAGDQQGNLKTYRLFRESLYEKELKRFFNGPGASLTEKTRMRCINIHEHSLRRLYTAYEAKSWNLGKISSELKRMALSHGFLLYAGPIVHLIRRYATLFMYRYRNSSVGHDVKGLEKAYMQFESTIRSLIRHFGLKNNFYCQLVLKTLGARLMAMMTHENFIMAITEFSRRESIPRPRNLQQLIGDLHVQCEEATLVHIYEELLAHLVRRNDHGYMEALVDFICQRLRGHDFDPMLPNPMLLKMVDVLVLLVEKREYCPIKLCYRLLKEEVNISIISYLQIKVNNRNCRKVFSSAYLLSELLSDFDDISDVLKEINKFPELFPEKFKREMVPFYREFTFVFRISSWILAFPDAIVLATVPIMEPYGEETHWFKVMIAFFNQVIEQIGKMKHVFQQCLSFDMDQPVPLEALNALRAYFKYIVAVDAKEFKMGDIYYRLFFSVVDHLEKILTEFCETTLPIQTLEQTANSLDSYLEEIRNQQKPIPALDNPDTLVIYNRYFNRMFHTLIVGIQPHKAYFNYPLIENHQKTKYLDIYNYKSAYVLKKPGKETKHEYDWIKGAIRSPDVQEFPLHLPDLTSPEYGKYRFVFKQPEAGGRFGTEKVRRFQGFVTVLNQYIMAFNSMTAAEMQSRFSHRLFAHQSKEPLLAMRFQIRALQDSHFLDIDGETTQEYYDRMKGLVEQMLKRSKHILNVRKKFRHDPPIPTKFNIKTMVDSVLKSMRKALSDSSLKGEILIENKHESEIDIEIYSDESKIREILEQLIGNSIKYCRGIRQIRLGIRFDRENVFFKVVDNGVGIPGNELPYIFTTYFRGDYGETYNIDGDGLGLWAAKSYAEMLGGEINAKNNPEEEGKPGGLTVILKLPRHFRSLKKEQEEAEHESK